MNYIRTNAISSLLRLLLVTILVTSASCARAGSGRSYFVSPDGDDNNDGKSAETAWRSLTIVSKTEFKPGDTIRFEGGERFESGELLFQSALLVNSSGLPDSPIVYTSYGNGKAVIVSDAVGIMCSGKEFIEFRELEVSGNFDPFRQPAQLNTNIGIWLINHNSDKRLRGIRIDNCRFTKLQTYAISVAAFNENFPKAGGFQDLKITDCKVDSIGDIAIIIDWAASYIHSLENYPIQEVLISNCEISNVTGLVNKLIPGTDKHDTFTGNGILIMNSDSSVIENNKIYNCGGFLKSASSGSGPSGIEAAECRRLICQLNEVSNIRATTGSDGHGIHFGNGVRESVMQYNYSHDNDGPGFSFHCYGKSFPLPNSNNVLRYCISARNGRNSVYNGCEILISSFNPMTTSNIDIYNNTILALKQKTEEYSAVEIERSASNITFRNNIVIAANKGTWIVNMFPLESRTSITFQRNLYWSLDDSYVFREGNDTFYTYDSWQSGSSPAAIRENINGKNSGIILDPKLKIMKNPDRIFDINAMISPDEFIPENDATETAAGIDLRKNFGTDIGIRDYYGNSILNVQRFSIGAYQNP
jgi:hypothetical protein